MKFEIEDKTGLLLIEPENDIIPSKDNAKIYHKQLEVILQAVKKTQEKLVNKVKVQLYHDDCIDIIPNLKNNVDLTFLDPPFNQGKEYENHNDLMPENEYWQMMEKICQYVYDKTNVGGAIYFMQREKNTRFVLNILESTGWNFQNMIIWRKKTSAVPMCYRHGKNYQVITFATKGERPHVFNKLRIDPELPVSYKQKRDNGIFVTDVWDDIRELTSGYFAGDEPITDSNGRFHKQQTSLEILLRIILSSTKKNDMILDPFAGTGTTSLVASQLNRNSISIEKSKKNISCIKKRIENIRDVDNIERHYNSYYFTENLSNIWGKRVKQKKTILSYT